MKKTRGRTQKKKIYPVDREAPILSFYQVNFEVVSSEKASSHRAKASEKLFRYSVFILTIRDA